MMELLTFPKKLFSKVRELPWREYYKTLKYLPRVMGKTEKIIVAVFLGIGLLAGSLAWYFSYVGKTKPIPSFGGDFTEGIVGETKDLGNHDARLLEAGLTKYDTEGKIVPDIAKSWEILDGGKTYIFHLRDEFYSNDLISQISEKNVWKDIDISTPDDKTLKFVFKQPFSPFLNVSTEPIFDYGPYRIFKETKQEVEFVARDDYYAGRPYIDEINLRFYDSEDNLIKAAKRGDIQSFSLSRDVELLDNYKKLEMTLPRDLDLFFNLSKKDIQDVRVRKALKENTSPGKELNLRLVVNDNPKNIDFAKKIADRWASLGVKITLDIKDNVSLQKDIIPKRDYDLLLYGLDYGEDPDPYPFWHSSQAKEDGKNLSNFKNTKADKLLEDARQELDAAKRDADYAEFQKILDSEVPMFVVEHQNYYYEISNKIKGIEKISGTNETDRFLNVASWFINTKREKK